MVILGEKNASGSNRALLCVMRTVIVARFACQLVAQFCFSARYKAGPLLYASRIAFETNRHRYWHAGRDESRNAPNRRGPT
jgi:hypothetical protein